MASSEMSSTAFVSSSEGGLLRSQELFWSKMMAALAVTQLIIGSACVAFHIAAFFVSEPFPFVVEGILIGAVILLAGVFGTAASRRGNACMMVTFLTISSVAGLFALFPMVFGVMGATSMLGESLSLMMPISQLVLATVELIVATWSIGIASQALCCPNSLIAQSANAMMGERLTQFVSTGDGQHIIVFSSAAQRVRHIPYDPYYNGQAQLLVQQGVLGLPVVHPGLMPYQPLQCSTSDVSNTQQQQQIQQRQTSSPPAQTRGHKLTGPNIVVGATKDDIPLTPPMECIATAANARDAPDGSSGSSGSSSSQVESSPPPTGEQMTSEANFDLEDERACLLGN